MATTLLEFQTPVVRPDGGRFMAAACGRECDDGRWEAWIEFENVATGEVVRTPRETTQPNFRDAEYWATGLTHVYLEGALDRILRPRQPRSVPAPKPPHFDGPAVLNPFSVYDKNPDALAQELTALRAWHLRQIVREYDLADAGDAPIEDMTERELGALILRRVGELRQ